MMSPAADPGKISVPHPQRFRVEPNRRAVEAAG